MTAFWSLSLLGLILNSQETTALPISGKRSTVTGFKTFPSRRDNCKQVCWGGLSVLRLHNLKKHPGKQLPGPSGLGWSCTRQVFFRVWAQMSSHLPIPPCGPKLSQDGKRKPIGTVSLEKLLSCGSVKSDTEAQTQGKKKILICSYATLGCKSVPILNPLWILLSFPFSPAHWGELAALVKILLPCLAPIHQKVKP